MIALHHARVRLAERVAVDGVTLRVERDSWTMLIGPNGAGKTTLLRAVAGMVGHEGSIAVAGVDPRALSVRARARTMAVVPQSPSLPPDMTVFEYVRLGRTAHLGMLGRPGSSDRDAADGAIARLGLESLTDRPLATISGGERQRAVLARALAQEAPVLLLDEPTSALDVGRQQEALELVAELQAERGLTVLGAMHDLTLAGQYADRVALLDEGRLVRHGSPADVLTQDLIARHYRARVHVAELSGAPVVLPTRAGG